MSCFHQNDTWTKRVVLLLGEWDALFIVLGPRMDITLPPNQGYCLFYTCRHFFLSAHNWDQQLCYLVPHDHESHDHKLMSLPIGSLSKTSYDHNLQFYFCVLHYLCFSQVSFEALEW